MSSRLPPNVPPCASSAAHGEATARQASSTGLKSVTNCRTTTWLARSPPLDAQPSRVAVGVVKERQNGLSCPERDALRSSPHPLRILAPRRRQSDPGSDQPREGAGDGLP